MKPYHILTENRSGVNFCTDCREVLDEDFIYCPYCGKKARIIQLNEKTSAFIFGESEIEKEP